MTLWQTMQDDISALENAITESQSDSGMFLNPSALGGTLVPSNETVDAATFDTPSNQNKVLAFIGAGNNPNWLMLGGAALLGFVLWKKRKLFI